MSLRSAVYTLLKTSELDVYPYVAQQGVTDTYVVYSIRREVTRTQDGVDVNDVYVTLNIYDSDLDDAISMGATMYSALENASGTYDSQTLHIGLFLSEDGGYLMDLEKYYITQEYLLRFL